MNLLQTVRGKLLRVIEIGGFHCHKFTYTFQNEVKAVSCQQAPDIIHLSEFVEPCAAAFLVSFVDPRKRSPRTVKSYHQLATALNITGFLAGDLFDRSDIIATEMSEAKMRPIAELVKAGVAVGILAATTTGPIILLLYCAAGILIMGVGVLVVGGPLKWLGFF